MRTLIILALVGIALAAGTPGTLDGAFGSGGLVDPPLQNGTWASVAVQADGKVVVAGREDGDSADTFVVARYNENGSLDTTFGTGGFVKPFSEDGWAESVVLDTSGGILVLGRIEIRRETKKGKKTKVELVGTLALVRLLDNGLERPLCPGQRPYRRGAVQRPTRAWSLPKDTRRAVVAVNIRPSARPLAPAGRWRGETQRDLRWKACEEQGGA